MNAEAEKTPVKVKVLPSEFMRKAHPEHYSDTEDRVTYVLDGPTLEYQLDAITAHNNTHDFEVFCRKLCERTICPNLRPQTGPEGGGDSKADTETFPVADEILQLTYVGQPNNGKERWAFAFSAKKKWADKVRHDVHGLVGTGRSYDRIICVTSRFARAKDRAALEDELKSKCGVPVTIHDRSWIVKEVIENDHRDLAAIYLKVGEAKNSSLHLGPRDYSRTQQLDEIERALADPNAFKGMEIQRVTEALVAAKLSRKLERTRVETDGRFLRAIRLAELDGTHRQVLEATYEHLWTGFWWFNDAKFLNSLYGEFAAKVLRTDHAKNIEFLCNLHQLLINSVIHGFMTREECRLDERTVELKRALDSAAADTSRPNNALEARCSLAILRLGRAIIDRKREQLPGIWAEFTACVHDAEGLGEFNADRLVQIVEGAGAIAGNDSSYNVLIERTAEFVAKRRSESEGARILLNRARKLDFADRFDMIRLLGRAAIGLVKRECAEDQVEALQLLTLAYRSAGLLWAARATCIHAACSLVIEGEEGGTLPIGFVPTMKLLAWIALELRHLPDFLFAVQMLNGAFASLPLDEASKTKVQEDLIELDVALGSILLNQHESQLQKFDQLPDIFGALGLYTARSALLYVLGHMDSLRSEGYFSATETDEDVNRFFSQLASQPVGEGHHVCLFCKEEPQKLSTKIMGMTIDVVINGTVQSIVISEIVLGALEAFFATAMEQGALAHTESLRITLQMSGDALSPSFEMDSTNSKATLLWPDALLPAKLEKQPDVLRFLTDIAARILCATCSMPDALDLVKKLYEDDAVQHRMVLITTRGTSYHRLTSKDALQVVNWQSFVKNTYELRPPTPTLNLVKIGDDGLDNADFRQGPVTLKDHRKISVRSVIDINTWNEAHWKGAAYLDYGPDVPPLLALLFEREEPARNIFAHWRERFGERDTNDDIHLAIVRALPNHDPSHYCILITSKMPEHGEVLSNQLLLMASRSMVMEPESDANLRHFLETYDRKGVYYLLPAVLTGDPMPKLLTDVAILKRNLIVKLASEVNEHDIEMMAIHRPPGY